MYLGWIVNYHFDCILLGPDLGSKDVTLHPRVIVSVIVKSLHPSYRQIMALEEMKFRSLAGWKLLQNCGLSTPSSSHAVFESC